MRDIGDLMNSNLVVADLLGGISRRGGMMIEIGYALGLGKTVILIGDPATCGIFGHVFTRVFPDWQSCIVEYF